MTMDDRIYIVAGHARSADYWRREQRLSADQVVYVARAEQLAGRRNVMIVRLADQWAHPEASTIERAARIVEAMSGPATMQAERLKTTRHHMHGPVTGQ